MVSRNHMTSHDITWHHTLIENFFPNTPCISLTRICKCTHTTYFIHLHTNMPMHIPSSSHPPYTHPTSPQSHPSHPLNTSLTHTLHTHTLTYTLQTHTSHLTHPSHNHTLHAHPHTPLTHTLHTHPSHTHPNSHIRDTAGQERFRTLTNAYFRGAAVSVFTNQICLASL